MTLEELKEALLQGATGCVEMNVTWWNPAALVSEVAYNVAVTFEDAPPAPTAPAAGDDSAFFLLLVREAVE